MRRFLHVNPRNWCRSPRNQDLDCWSVPLRRPIEDSMPVGCRSASYLGRLCTFPRVAGFAQKHTEQDGEGNTRHPEDAAGTKVGDMVLRGSETLAE